MPTNANTFNSRVTSEALEAKFRQVFPSQSGAELVQDLFASGVIQPVIDFSTVAEGSVLASNLQTAWDFSTGSNQIIENTVTMVSNPGFWLVDANCVTDASASVLLRASIAINDGSSTKRVWGVSSIAVAGSDAEIVAENKFVVFLRSGDTLEGFSANTATTLDVWYRQIADLYGNLVNPLGFAPQ